MKTIPYDTVEREQDIPTSDKNSL